MVAVFGAIVFWSLQDAPQVTTEQSGSETQRQLLGTELAPSAQLDSGGVEAPLLSASPVATSTEPVSQWMPMTLTAMALALLVSTAISFYLYRWRKILLNQTHLVVPEQFGQWTLQLARDVNELSRALAASNKLVAQQSRDTHRDVSNLSETFMTMQQALDEREREIQRLKRGYDAHVFRKFVSRFIRVDQAVEDFQKAGSADANGLDQIRRLLEDAFAECDVERFQPEVGDDYREAFGVADQPKTIEGENLDDAFKIAGVLESGYLIRSADSCEVVIPAKVTIYKHHERGAS
jgi:uncharacterized protein YukE